MVETEKTVFELILEGKVPAKKVFEDDEVLAFEDVAPQAPVHVLVIPKKKMVSVADLVEADDAATGRFFRRAALVARQLGLEADGYRMVSNHGRHGQQSVAYLHVHILAGRQLSWPPG